MHQSISCNSISNLWSTAMQQWVPYYKGGKHDIMWTDTIIKAWIHTQLINTFNNCPALLTQYQLDSRERVCGSTNTTGQPCDCHLAHQHACGRLLDSLSGLCAWMHLAGHFLSTIRTYMTVVSCAHNHFRYWLALKLWDACTGHSVQWLYGWITNEYSSVFNVENVEAEITD